MFYKYSCYSLYQNFTVTFLIFAYAHERINILVSAMNIIFFRVYDVDLNTQNCVLLELVKYQLSLRRNMPVFAKYNV